MHTHTHTHTRTHRAQWKRKVYALVCNNFDCFHCNAVARHTRTHTYIHSNAYWQANTSSPSPLPPLSTCPPFVSSLLQIFVLLMCCLHFCLFAQLCNRKRESEREKQQRCKICRISSTVYFFASVRFLLSANKFMKNFSKCCTIKVAQQTKRQRQRNVQMNSALNTRVLGTL